MADLGIFDRTTVMLGKVLDLRQQNQQVIASNIAHATTPGYSPAKMSFEGDLKQALERQGTRISATHGAHFPLAGGGSLEQVQGRVLRTPDQTGVGDLNGVKPDQELLDLAENQLLYEAATQMLSKKLGLLKYVANDGR